MIRLRDFLDFGGLSISPRRTIGGRCIPQNAFRSQALR